MLAHCRYPPYAYVIDGIDTKNNVIKRMDNGFRDDEHFLVPIRAAIPGGG